MPQRKMTERDLVKKLKKLEKRVRPDKEWVAFCRRELLNEFSRKEETLVDQIISPVNAISAIDFANQLLFGALRLSPVKAVVTIVIMILMVGGLVFNFSQNALPGSVFYSLKLGSENLALKLVPGQENQFLLHTKLAERRLGEISALSQNAETNAEFIFPVLENYKEELASAKDYLESTKHNGKAVKVAQILNESTQKYQSSLIDAAIRVQDEEKKVLGEALKHTEDANLEALTVLSFSSEQNQEFTQKLKEKIELKISYLENKLSDIEDENISEQVKDLIETAKTLLEAGDLVGALDAVSGAEGILGR